MYASSLIVRRPEELLARQYRGQTNFEQAPGICETPLGFIGLISLWYVAWSC